MAERIVKLHHLDGEALLERIAEVIHAAADEHIHDSGVSLLRSLDDPKHTIKTCHGCGEIAEDVGNLLILNGRMKKASKR